MYKEFSEIAADHYIKHGIIKESKRDVYRYGFEVLLSTLVYTIIFIVTAIISNTFIESLIFWLGFFIVRTIAGGYHAKTYIACHLLFMTTHLLFISILKLSPAASHIYISLTMMMVSSVLLFLFAPVAHPNKPFIKSEKKRFRKYSCIYAILLLLVSAYTAILIPPKYVYYLLSYAIGTFSAAISLISAKILYK